MKRSFAAAASLLLGGTAFAQDEPQPASASPEVRVAEAYGDIIVTARRRAESAQKVPIALTALSGEQVAPPGVLGLTQVSQLAPSLQLTATNARQTNINIRGLGATPAFASLGLEYGVGVYVDQVYLSRPAQTAFDLFDLERVEVLRGPQGTLFGKNTTAGAINISSRAPSFDPEFTGELSLGNYGAFQARATGSTAITDDVAVRLTVTNTTRERGFIRNVRGGRLADLHSFSGRGQLLFKLSDAASLRLIGDYSDLSQDCCIGTMTSVRTTRVDGSPLPNNFYQRAARFNYQPLPIDPFARRVDLNRKTNLALKTGGVTGIFDIDVGSATITSVTAWRKLHYRPNIDGDTLGLDIFTNAGVVEDQEQFSQELRIASNSPDAVVDYVAGLYYFDQTIDNHFFTYYGSDAALWILGPAAGSTGPSIGGQAALNGLMVDGYAQAKTRSKAAFGQLVWHITDRFDLTAGARYTWERKSGFFEQFQSGPALTPTQILFGAQAIRNSFGPNVPRFDLITRENKFSGLVTASYQITDDVLAYATYARGFKSGGLNLNPTNAPRVIAPERVDSFDIGLKTSLLDRRVTFNLSAFETRIRNYQSQQIDTAVAQVAYIANVGTVRSRGIEADLTVRPARGLSLFASGAYIDAVYRDFSNAPCPVEYLGLQAVCDLSGRNLPGVSKYSGSIGGNYSMMLNSGSEVYVNGDYSYRSRYNATYNLPEDSEVKAFGVANARIGIRSSNANWDISLYARNLFNEKYISNINPAAFNTGQYSGSPGEPRTYGVALRTSL